MDTPNINQQGSIKWIAICLVATWSMLSAEAVSDSKSVQYRPRSNISQSVQYRLRSNISQVGIFEMSIDGVWGNIVRDDNYTNSVAEVLCRSLNMRTDGARFVNPGEFFPNESAPFWLRSLNCTGHEQSPLDCEHSQSTVGFPTSLVRPVAVYCGAPYKEKDYALRLVDGPNAFSGRLEIMMFGRWGTVCDQDFSIGDVDIVCVQLNIITDVSSPMKAKSGTYPRGRGKIWMTGVNCENPKFPSLRACKHPPVSAGNNCTHSQDVGVICASIYVPDIPDPAVIPHDNWPSSGTEGGDGDSGDDGDHTGFIAGGSVGGGVFFFIVFTMIYLRWRQQREDNERLVN